MGWEVIFLTLLYTDVIEQDNEYTVRYGLSPGDPSTGVPTPCSTLQARRWLGRTKVLYGDHSIPFQSSSESYERSRVPRVPRVLRVTRVTRGLKVRRVPRVTRGFGSWLELKEDKELQLLVTCWHWLLLVVIGVCCYWFLVVVVGCC